MIVACLSTVYLRRRANSWAVYHVYVLPLSAAPQLLDLWWDLRTATQLTTMQCLAGE